MISDIPHLPGRFKEAMCSHATTWHDIKGWSGRQSTAQCRDFQVHVEGGGEKEKPTALGILFHCVNLVRR